MVKWDRSPEEHYAKMIYEKYSLSSEDEDMDGIDIFLSDGTKLGLRVLNANLHLPYNGWTIGTASVTMRRVATGAKCEWDKLSYDFCVTIYVNGSPQNLPVLLGYNEMPSSALLYLRDNSLLATYKQEWNSMFPDNKWRSEMGWQHDRSGGGLREFAGFNPEVMRKAGVPATLLSSYACLSWQ